MLNLIDIWTDWLNGSFVIYWMISNRKAGWFFDKFFWLYIFDQLLLFLFIEANCWVYKLQVVP